MTTIRSASATDVGRKRSNNEDALFVDDELGLYVVCDGMGGHACGEVAARMTIDCVRQRVAEHRAVIREVAAGERDHAALIDVLTEVVEGASSEVYRAATTDSDLSGMGCTLTLLLVAGSRGAMAHVGDTRLYLCRDGAAEQLSTDHTMAELAVRRGEMTRTVAESSAYSSVLTRVIGQQERVAVETLMLDVLADDAFLICSDGLSMYVEGLAEFASLMNQRDIDATAGALIQLALERGGADNVSVIVARAESGDGEQSRILSADVRADVECLQSIDWLSDLSFASILRLLAIAESHSLAAGETVVDEQGALDSLWIVSSGRLELQPKNGLAIGLVPGDYFGETGLVVARTPDFSVRARETSRVLRIRGTAFEQLAKKRPWLGVNVLTRLARRLERDLARETH